MLKRIVSRILRTKILSRVFIKHILNLHSFCYELAGGMAVQVENGVHPKHRIMRYKEWFLDNINEGDVVLDVGCNTGMMPALMSQRAKFVYGIEIDPEHILEANKNQSKDNVKFICADATTFDYSDCLPINCITLSNVLEHIENRVEFLTKLVSKINWEHGSNKKILIRVPMIDREWITVYKKDLGLDYRLDRTHFTEYTFHQLQQELAMSGINIISHHVRFGELYAICTA